MTPLLHRRGALRTLGAGLGLAATLPLARLAFSAAPRTPTPSAGRLVFVLLRGGLDGLFAVPVPGDPRFAALRGAFHEGPPPLPLSGPFALHPALTSLHAAWQQGSLAIVHATSSPYRGRSHFDGQDALESGGAVGTLGSDTGWLGRAARAAGVGGLALSASAPLVLRGAAPLETWSPSPYDEPADDLLARLAPMYRGHPGLQSALEGARREATTRRDGEKEAQGAEPMAAGRAGGGALRADPATLAERCADVLSEPAGPAVAVLELGGWDSHAGQAAPDGRLVRSLRGLSDVVEGLTTGLAPLWSRCCVVVASEFGRTVAVNGTRGTDHGTGGVCFVLGGGVAGGRVSGAWPGLAPGDLYEGRDLRPTTDLRGVLKAALHATLGLSEGALAETVFPDSATITPLEGLFRRG
jgi:uncharacterized protein (DUF1501 family)